MKTNFQMLRELINEKKFEPESHGFLSGDEVKLIEETLCINEMDILTLRNLRDFTVMWLCSLDDNNKKDDTRDFYDIMSGITAVIDRRILERGARFNTSPNTLL